ncbi:class I SAM-dependent methyltransferase [Bacillus massiliglaciei]|uniref:class I SAM-dependent methyltransferase n=1 Tax=Bacillus massiliglaciei TaxID=1816693 RepID=UPI000B101354|nr:class I SAM-dependent methyltransferase [Bacillus massiliglaciei]
MFVTAAGRADAEVIQKAEATAADWKVPYIPRRKKSIPLLLEENQDSECLVYGKQRMELYTNNSNQPFFFHPNMAAIRIKRLLHGETDPYIEAAGMNRGDSVLDCTLGLGSDAVVASFYIGEKGAVTGIEGSKHLARILEKGLQDWESGEEEIREAMRRVKVVNGRHLEILKSLPDKSWDIVYFDPMFDEAIHESSAIRAIDPFSTKDALTKEAINEAKRVARKRVVLKDHFRSPRFAQFGFQVLVRKTSKFHFGYLETGC